MKIILFTILIFLWNFDIRSQDTNRVETIPLETIIQVQINSIDSTTLDLYNIYHFTYKSTDKIVNARFWTTKNHPNLNKGLTTVQLCRIWQVKFGDGTGLRGHALSNTLSLSTNDTIHAEFDFNEYGESPTLRLCSTE